MSKGQLEEARINIDWDKGKIPPDLLPHINYLFKQAERAEQNKKDWLKTMKRLENYKKVASLNHEEIQRLHEQNKRYREALEFYANKNIWVEQEVTILMDGEPSKAYDAPLAIEDSGNEARKALEGDADE